MKLYTVFEVIPSRMIGLANLLRTTKNRALTRADILDLLQPPFLRKGANSEPDMAKKVISAALDLGLAEESENDRGERCLNLPHGVGIPSEGDLLSYWSRWIAKRVLCDLVDDSSLNIATIFSWFMTLRAQDIPTNRKDWKERFAHDGFDLELFGLNNDARWDNLFDWGRFLGLIWQMRTGREMPGVVCDPTTLLVRFIDELLPTIGTVEVGEFREKLGQLFPPFDGGHLSNEVRRKIATARGEPLDQTDRWSPGLGMAIRGLRDRGIISYDCPDDQRTFMLFEDGEKIAFLSRLKGGES
jgi:hypothetical protein